jgi:hypothetical protein
MRKYRKSSPPLPKTYRNVFITLSFMCSGGRSTFSEFNNGEFLTLNFTVTTSSLADQFFTV